MPPQSAVKHHRGPAPAVSGLFGEGLQAMQNPAPEGFAIRQVWVVLGKLSILQRNLGPAIGQIRQLALSWGGRGPPF